MLVVKERERPSCFRASVVKSSDGVALDVFEAGDPGKPAVVLVNAYAMPVAFWEPLAAQLSSDYHLLTWESRGLLDLTRPFDPGRCGVPEHSADLEAVLDGHGVGTAKVIAWCSGAQVTLHFASRTPQRVESAVFLSGAFRTLPAIPQSTFQTATSVLFRQCAGSRERTQVICAMLFAGHTAASSPAAESTPTMWGQVPAALAPMTVAPFLTPESLYRYANTILAVDQEPAHAWTEGVKMPVLLVGGERDAVVHPAVWGEIARRLPHARTVISPEGDHYMLHQDPSMAAVVRAFFGGDPPGQLPGGGP